VGVQYLRKYSSKIPFFYCFPYLLIDSYEGFENICLSHLLILAGPELLQDPN